MKRILLVSFSAALLGALAVLSGCTTKSTESTPKMTGDTTSSQFQTATVVFDSAMEVGMGQFLGVMDLASLAAKASGAPGNVSQVPSVVEVPVYHLESKYWYLIRSGVEYVRSSTNQDSIVDSVAWTAIDSLQFREGDSAVFKPDSALWTELRAGCSFVAHSQMKEDSLRSGRHFAVTGAPGALWSHGDIVVNGSGSTDALFADLRPPDDTTAVCGIGVSLVGVWNDVHANLAAVSASVSCPSSGVINQNGALSVACTRGADSLRFGGMWNGSLAYTDGQVTAVYESPSTRWSVTRACPSSHSLTSASAILRIRH